MGAFCLDEIAAKKERKRFADSKPNCRQKEEKIARRHELWKIRTMGA
jgi:hypothetical protein